MTKKAIWIVLGCVLVVCTGGYLYHHATSRPSVPQANATQAHTQQIKPTQIQLAPSARESDDFDEPLSKIVVDLGQSPYLSKDNPEHSTLRCMYYATLVVKELDMKEQGDEWIAIAPSKSDKRPLCVQEHGKDEFEIKDTDGHGWAGYFAGVKGNLIFLDGDDGYNEGIPFGVFDAMTGKKVFEDSAEYLNNQRLHITNNDGLLMIHYRRVDAAECSIPQKKGQCWEQIRKRADLVSQPMPQCTGYDQRGFDDTDPSVVSYPYEVTLLPVVRKRVLPGEVKCWAAD